MVLRRLFLAACCLALSACDTMPPETELQDSTSDVQEVVFEDQEWSEHPFLIHWPPVSPDSPKYKTRALLDGKLLAAIDGCSLRIAILLERPSAESDRRKWNQLMEFPEYEWMSNVHVWDVDQKWLWPNLPYLLRAYGEERVQRYGGVDPKKFVDNDFAPVVVRYESDTLLSAEWHGSSVDTNRRSVVHTARSDIFSVELELAELEGASKKLVVDLVFADFMDWKPPAGWPTEPEMAGGILASAVLSVGSSEGLAAIEEVAFRVPDSSTGVDWEAWERAGQPRILASPAP